MPYFDHPKPDLGDQPVLIDQWRILRVKAVSTDCAADLLVGRELGGSAAQLGGQLNLGRVSTRLVELDLQRKIARTQSGRRYELGEAGFDEDSEYVFQEKFGWYVAARQLVVADVTAELLAGGEITP